MYLGDIATAVAVLGADGRPRGAINVAVSRARWHAPRTNGAFPRC